jgi:hypothetical protein
MQILEILAWLAIALAAAYVVQETIEARRIRQWRCGRRGHPYPPIEIPICGQRPDEPETDQVFCSHCGAHLSTRYTDGAGTEIRDT